MDFRSIAQDYKPVPTAKLTGPKTSPYDFLKRLYLNILFSNTFILQYPFMFISFVLIQVKRTSYGVNKYIYFLK